MFAHVILLITQVDCIDNKHEELWRLWNELWFACQSNTLKEIYHSSDNIESSSSAIHEVHKMKSWILSFGHDVHKFKTRSKF